MNHALLVVVIASGVTYGTPLLFDTFNDPHLTLPARGDAVTVSFPAEACLVLEDGAATPKDIDDLEI